jgi:hypothetical protein
MIEVGQYYQYYRVFKVVAKLNKGWECRWIRNGKKFYMTSASIGERRRLSSLEVELL